MRLDSTTREGIVAFVFLAVILWFMWLKPWKRADEFRACMAVTGNASHCNAKIYPEKTERWNAWKRGARP